MASAATTHFLQFRIQYSSIALLWYDYSLTFPDEVKYIWRSETWKVSTLLYIFCRYALFANVLYLLAIANKLGTRYATISAVMDFMFPAYDATALPVFKSVGIDANSYRCSIHDRLDRAANTLLSILVCVFESLATALTIFRSVQALQARGNSLHRKYSFHYFLLEQGRSPIVPPSLLDINVKATRGTLLRCSVVVHNDSCNPQFSRSCGLYQFRSNLLHHYSQSFDSVGRIFTTTAQRLHSPVSQISSPPPPSPSSHLSSPLFVSPTSLSGLLTARFLLHLRALSAQTSQRSLPSGGPGRRQSRTHTVSAFRAAARVVSEFGEDPVEHAREVGEDEGESEMVEVAPFDRAGLKKFEEDREHGMEFVEGSSGLRVHESADG
ncbi:hypothetical protein EW146_g7495 [Bondarzewia mesenterica]|uniref:DUF6533 domain-containing protein n=1 Tax=Bondarzewia mesenterica TaxID=1095465 RepID=A0A4S4LKM5_9AGAM|nr:hypothetical protein EW146_g7495 [Bondarzewia mesenterica]